MGDHLKDRTILVTGAGSGFGRLIAERAAAAGARVACADVAGDRAQDTAAAIAAAGGQALAATCDVTRIDDLRAAVAACVERFGALDVLVNNAGIMPLAFLADHEKALDAWHRCIDINFKGVVNGTVAAHDQMIAQGRGHIVNISSTYGNYPVVGSSVYGATKAAIDYYSHSVRQESHGRIKVTLVKPTGVPGTGLGASVVNGGAAVGIVGQNAGSYFGLIGRMMQGELTAAETDAADIGYAMLDPVHIADAVFYAIDQPWGVQISDLTVRASGDVFVL